MSKTKSILKSALAVATAMCALAPLQARAAGFVQLSNVGDDIMTNCNPNNRPNLDRCRVASLPGIGGYSLVASRTSPIVKNEVTIGTLSDRVWKDKAGNYIFGTRVQLNAQPYNLTGLSFNANDVFRQVLPNRGVAIAYSPTPGAKALIASGRTVQGLNEAPEPDPTADPPIAGGLERDNGWVDFSVDVNAAEPVGPSAPNSPWLLVQTKAPAGYSIQAFALRILSSDFADFSEFEEIFLSGYQPN
jgi:hypothetical protein